MHVLMVWIACTCVFPMQGPMTKSRLEDMGVCFSHSVLIAHKRPLNARQGIPGPSICPGEVS